jgi:hypothetical protein
LENLRRELAETLREFGEYRALVDQRRSAEAAIIDFYRAKVEAAELGARRVLH